MCLICKDWELGKLTIEEAYRNLKEVYDEKENPHSIEVWIKLAQSELESMNKI